VGFVQEVTGLRNQYLDTFLPPRRKQGRKAAQQQQQQQLQEPMSNGGEAPGNGAEEPQRQQRIKLQFMHFPVTDLSVPTTAQCGFLCSLLLPACLSCAEVCN
jgi:hypothetical protein